MIPLETFHEKGAPVPSSSYQALFAPPSHTPPPSPKAPSTRQSSNLHLTHESPLPKPHKPLPYSSIYLPTLRTLPPSLLIPSSFFLIHIHLHLSCPQAIPTPQHYTINEETNKQSFRIGLSKDKKQKQRWEGYVARNVLD